MEKQIRWYVFTSGDRNSNASVSAYFEGRDISPDVPRTDGSPTAMWLCDNREQALEILNGKAGGGLSIRIYKRIGENAARPWEPDDERPVRSRVHRDTVSKLRTVMRQRHLKGGPKTH